MKIIDNKKDYYDYLSGIFGIDEYITYDRRNSVKLCNNVNKGLTSRRYVFNEYPYFPEFFCPWRNGIHDNRKSINDTSHKWDIDSNGLVGPDGIEYANVKDSGYIGILIGFKLYIFRVYRCLENELDPNVKLIPILKGKKTIDRKTIQSAAPIIIGYLTNDYHISYMFNKEKYERDFIGKTTLKMSSSKDYVENPIFVGTWIPANIDAKDIWNDITDYLLSLKDKPIIDNRTDIEHLESAGFDKKSSFRNL